MMTDEELGRIRDHATGNPDTRGDTTLRLLAEVEQCRAEKRELVWRLEELMDAWCSRRNEMVSRIATARSPADDELRAVAASLWSCVEELGVAIPEPTDGNTAEISTDVRPDRL